MSTLTQYFNIEKPSKGSPAWDTPLNENFDQIDEKLYQVAHCFASETQPVNATGNPVKPGRLWFNLANKTLQVLLSEDDGGEWDVLLTSIGMQTGFARTDSRNTFTADNKFAPTPANNGDKKTISFLWYQGSESNRTNTFEQKYSPDEYMLEFEFGRTAYTGNIDLANKIRYSFLPVSSISYPVLDIVSEGLLIYKSISVNPGANINFKGGTTYTQKNINDVFTIYTASISNLFELSSSDIKYKGVSLRPELFQLLDQKGQNNGYCPLDESGDVPAEHINLGTIDNSKKLGGIAASEYLQAKFPDGYASAEFAAPVIDGKIPPSLYVQAVQGEPIDTTYICYRNQSESISSNWTFNAIPSITSAPTSDTHAANKAYVDGKLSGNTTPLIPSGTVMVFAQPSAPSGWNFNGAYTDRILRCASSGAQTGGSVSITSLSTNTGSCTLTIEQMPRHTHRITGDDRMGQYSPYCKYENPQPPGQDWGSGGVEGGAAFTIEYVGGGQGHSHTLSISPKYVDVIFASKN